MHFTLQLAVSAKKRQRWRCSSSRHDRVSPSGSLALDVVHLRGCVAVASLSVHFCGGVLHHRLHRVTATTGDAVDLALDFSASYVPLNRASSAAVEAGGDKGHRHSEDDALERLCHGHERGGERRGLRKLPEGRER